jgi:hypothetical protein
MWSSNNPISKRNQTREIFEEIQRERFPELIRLGLTGLTRQGWIALTGVRRQARDGVAGAGLAGPRLGRTRWEPLGCAGPHTREAREGQAGPAVRLRAKAIFMVKPFSIFKTIFQFANCFEFNSNLNFEPFLFAH